MAKAGAAARAALVVIGIVLVGMGAVLLVGASGSTASGIGGALTGLAEAIGIGMALLGGLLLVLAIATSAKRAARVEHGESAAPWPPDVRSRPDKDEPRN